MTSKSTGGKAKVKTPDGKASLDLDAIADHFVSRFVGMVLRRTRKGIDMHGVAFEGYSVDYANRLYRTGRDGSKVDLTLSGSMLGNMGELSRTKTGKDTLTVVIGPDSSHGPKMVFQAHTGADDVTTQDRWVEEGQRTKSNAQIGAYHHNGEGHNPRRQWLGLTPEETKKLAAEISRLNGAVVLKKS